MCDICGANIRYIRRIYKQDLISEYDGVIFNCCLITELVRNMSYPDKVIDLNNVVIKSCGCILANIEEQAIDEEYTRLFKITVLPNEIICMGGGLGTRLDIN
jgi:hypothetical protein